MAGVYNFICKLKYAKLSALIILSILSQLLLAQNYLYEIKYQCTTHLENGNILSGETTLYFNKDSSLFIHNDVPAENKYVNKGNISVFLKSFF